ncbi:late competence protein ComER [Metabacillus halosaccharovorans]|uniref:Pyrroline-5-carboxylate reductase n=1 Tax=Metabacillus halosaccharovorans TaxID=930124 RepID=A0ABT3DCZ7_9BACI|nr:late competence protein ComER [Metabacillus halosaccharovorans]MCV9884924.1 late competence protein ComER [Metabacillus halosaccharovorans]
MNVGFIGTGNMGRILIESFVESGAIRPSFIYMTNRTITKAEVIKEIYPKTNVMETADEVVKRSDLVFICVKPLDIHPLLKKLDHLLTPNKCIVSITSPLSVEQLESLVHCQVARAIPSITNRAFSGVSLLTFGNSCHKESQRTIEELFEQISNPVQIEDDITRVSSDIVSCGPAFFSYLLQRFVDGAVTETNISKDQAVVLASEMIIGMGKLLETELYTLPTLQEKVCVKGGVTGKGIEVLEENVGDMFEKIFQATHKKFDEDLVEVSEQFSKIPNK